MRFIVARDEILEKNKNIYFFDTLQGALGMALEKEMLEEKPWVISWVIDDQNPAVRALRYLAMKFAK